MLANEISEAAARGGSDIPAFLTNPSILIVVASAVIAVVLWSAIHGVLIRPFILVGVMRNFMNAGIADIPSEEDFKALDSKSPKFAKLHQRIN